MGIFEQFPYSNFHNANLDNVLNNSNQALRDAANAVHIAGEAKDIAEGLADDVATALQEAEAASTAAASAEATAAQAQAEAEAVSGLAQDAYDLASAADSAAANALSVANTANSNASAAVATANAASTNASAAVSTANTASTNASAAVSTANAALNAVNNIPDASTTERGLVSTGDQTFAGKKTFNARIIANASSTGDGATGSIVAQGGNPSIVSYNTTLNKYIELVAGSSGNRGLYTGDGWVLYLGGDGKLHFGKPVDATNLPDASTTERGLVQFPITIAQGGTGQTGQTAQQSYTPTVKIGTTTPTVSSRSAYYKSWGLMKLIGGRFNLTTTGTGQLIISLPTGFTVPTLAVQPMGILIAPDQKAYHIRVAADGLVAMSNGGSNVAWTTGYYCFWAVVMGN